MDGLDSDERSKVVKLWKKIWEAKVPSKIQILVQRPSRECYLTQDRVKFVSNLLCPLCEEADETSFHAIRQCKMAMEVYEHRRSQKCDPMSIKI